MQKLRWWIVLLSLGAMPAFAANWSVFLIDDCPSDYMCFSPDQLTIPVGDTVTFSFVCAWLDCGPHNVAADDGSFRCARGCDDEGGDGTPADFRAYSFTRTFDKPGVVRFHDEGSAAVGFIFVGEENNTTVVEYYNPELEHYFIASSADEQAYVDTGAAGRWLRTGNTFKSGGRRQVCRFVGNPETNPATGRAYGPNSHFYTADPYECESLRVRSHRLRAGWKLESYDFPIDSPGGAGCAANRIPVYRAYNNGFARGINSNHRITSSVAAYRSTVAAGWIGEGVVMCAPG